MAGEVAGHVEISRTWLLRGDTVRVLRRAVAARAQHKGHTHLIWADGTPLDEDMPVGRLFALVSTFSTEWEDDSSDSHLYYL